MCGPARLDDRIALYKMGLADSFPGPKMCIWSTNDEINRGNARMTPYFEGRRDFGQDKQKACMEVVYTDTLDHLLFDTHGLARRVDVMKIDIEGFETRAFRGAARLLASDFKPCQIYFEYQHDATVESGVDRHELFERLTRAGYKLNDFMKNGEVGSFTPEQWDGMRFGDLRAVLDDASCGWSSRGPPPPPPPPRVVGREPPPGCGPEAAAECSTCSAGSPGDGGVSLVDGVCQEFCSVNGYCGVTENYESGGTDCTKCAPPVGREPPPPPPPRVVGREPPPGCGPEAAAECSTCSAGSPGDGGVSLVDGVCQEFCSVNGYCGVTENYESGGTDCTKCAPPVGREPPPPPARVRERAPPPPQPALVVVRERTKRIEALEAELAALKTSDAPEPRRVARDGFDRVPAFDVDGDGDVDVKDRTLEVMGVVLVLGLAAQLVLRRRARRRAD